MPEDSSKAWVCTTPYNTVGLNLALISWQKLRDLWTLSAFPQQKTVAKTEMHLPVPSSVLTYMTIGNCSYWSLALIHVGGTSLKPVLLTMCSKQNIGTYRNTSHLTVCVLFFSFSFNNIFLKAPKWTNSTLEFRLPIHSTSRPPCYKFICHLGRFIISLAWVTKIDCNTHKSGRVSTCTEFQAHTCVSTSLSLKDSSARNTIFVTLPFPCFWKVYYPE